MATYTITDETPISALNVGQLKNLLSGINPIIVEAIKCENVEYVYGLRGIGELFGVGHSTAQRYKNTFLKGAILQEGKKIRVDKAVAEKLYRTHCKEKETKN